MAFIKMILCILIVGAGAVSGQLKAKSYDNRLAHLKNLITMLKLLESEMKYRLDPLPEVFEHIGESRDGLAGELLCKASNILKNSQSSNLNQCWQTTVRAVYDGSSLTEKDKAILCDMGTELGKTDMDGQSSLFLRALTLLTGQAEEAEEEKKIKGKMYKSLGAAAGILIVIIFI